MTTLIAAVSENGCIGKENKLPWHIPADLAHFKEKTAGKAVLMGRKTFESVLGYLGKPLPGRKNIVVTRNPEYKAPEGVLVYESLEHALRTHTEDDLFVIGGAGIYEQTIGIADRLIITHVHQHVAGDAFFPTISPETWKEVSREDHATHSFVEYERIVG